MQRTTFPSKLKAVLLSVHFTVMLGAIAQPSQSPTPAVKPEKPDPGLVNQWLREQSSVFAPWDLGGQVRLRYEIKENAGSFPNRDFIRDGQDNDNSFFLSRVKLHVGYTASSWFKAYVEGRDSRSTGDDRNPNPESDQLDLHQAYFVLGSPEAFPLTFKLGRQEMYYGDERFIGIGDWGNVARVFDVAKLRYENKSFWVDFFSGRVNLPDDNNFNEPNDYDWFSGIYASTRTLIPKQEAELFFLSRNVGAGSPNAIATGLGGPGPRDVYTLGLQIKSLPGEFGGWDYGAELARQFGSVNLSGRRRELDALAAYVAGGYTFKCQKPPSSFRLGIEYNYASGDGDPNDNKTETFEPLFGTNHRLYGLMDLFGLRNIHNPMVRVLYKPTKKLTLSLDYMHFWLADDRDFLYPESGAGRSGNGYGRNPQFGKHVGAELDFVANYAIKPYANLQAGYGHFFVGDYVKSSVGSVPANGGAVDADWFYVQATFNF